MSFGFKSTPGSSAATILETGVALAGYRSVNRTYEDTVTKGEYMSARGCLTLALIAFFLPGFASSQETAKRPEWDQKKAVEKVKHLIALICFLQN